MRWVGRAATWMLATATCWTVEAHAQQPMDAVDYDTLAEMDLSQLLAAPTDVASARATGIRQSPGVLTLVTREEILGSGARDLVDVLQLVPGFFVAVDVQGTLGAGMRGLWGHEGKILYLLDGHPLNEMSYSTTQLGGRIPVEMIERIEIIRGPGSARYGGYAELAVVNIVLVEAKVPGTRAYASANYGLQDRGPNRQNLSLALSHKFNTSKDLSLTGRAHVSNAHPSDAQYRDLFGNQYDMRKGNRFRQALATLGVTYKRLELKYLFEDYRVASRDGYDAVPSRTYAANFLSHHLSAAFGFEPTAGLIITPRAEYHRQLPYNSPLDLERPLSMYTADELAEIDLYDYDRLAERTVAGVGAEWSLLDELTLSLGGQFQHDRAVVRSFDPAFSDLSSESLYSPNDFSATFDNWIGFAEASTENPWLNGTVGARYEHHSRFGGAFAPRVALGKVLGDFHAKALASQAFRSPGFENINLGVDLKPERTLAIELELGYQATKELLLTVNGFDLTVKRPIVYFFNSDTDREGYANRGRTGSRGLETELRFQRSRVLATASYAFYTSRHKNRVGDYAVAQDRAVLLGAPAHKATFNGTARVWQNLHANASAFLLSKRYAQVAVDTAGEPVLRGLAPTLMLNLVVDYRNLWVRGLTVGVGAYNVTGNRFTFPQPYKGLHAPLPGLAREFLVRASYDLPY